MYLRGAGWEPLFVEGDDPAKMHRLMADTLDKALDKIAEIQKAAREMGEQKRPTWPMIVLRSPKGWTGPKVVDGKTVEGSYRAHQVPVSADSPEHLKIIETWLKSYHPEELFDENGIPAAEMTAIMPEGDRRMGMNPHANGGKLLRGLRMPDFRDYAVDVPFPGAVKAQDMTELGGFVRDICDKNPDNFRVFGPDETASNRLTKVFDNESRCWQGISTTRTTVSPTTAGSWTLCSPSICVRVRWRAICSPAATAFSAPMRHSSVLWTPCSPSTPSG